MMNKVVYFLVGICLLGEGCAPPAPPEAPAPDAPASLVTYLDSLSAPLFSSLVRDTAFQNIYRFAPNEIVTYADTVYERRIGEIPSQIPLVYNELVQDYIDLYAMRKKDLTERMIGKSAWYYPMVEQVLREEQVPDILKHLTMVESAMYLKASSPKAATGLWQIRPATGRELGLEITPWIDQRRDPYASTRAAAVYLKELYQRYGDWFMAIAAYNYGIGNMSKAMAAAPNAKDFWELSPFLPSETRSYVPAFIAVVYLYHHQQEHNIRPAYFNLPFRKVDTLQVSPPSSLQQLSFASGTSLGVLNFLNPSFLQGTLPEGKAAYPVVMPQYLTRPRRYAPPCPPPAVSNTGAIRQIAQVIRKPYRVVPHPKKMSPLTHRIQPGNSLASIAQEYNCTVEDIIQWNGLYETTIRSGDALIVYVPRGSDEKYPTLVSR